MNVSIFSESDDTSPDYAYIIERLKAENDARAEVAWERRRVRLYARNEAGEAVAGLFGQVVMHGLTIDILWVDPRLRGQGTGAELLARAEAQACEAGAVWSVVETTSFQARPFYEQQGYAVFAELEDAPIGHTNYWMRKRL